MACQAICEAVKKMNLMNYAPGNKVAAGGAVGIITGFILYELSHRLNIVLSPEESSFLTFLGMTLAAYFTPHSSQQQPNPNPPQP